MTNNVYNIGTNTLKYKDMYLSNTASINGATLSVANNTLTATINNTQYPIAGSNVNTKVDLSTGGVIYNHPVLGMSIRWSLSGGQLQYIINPSSSYADLYSFTMSYNHNSSGVADFKYISGQSTFNSWRYFTTAGHSRDGEFDLASGGRYDFTLISDNPTKPSFIGSLFHAGTTGTFRIEVINT
jgi:hypothetical protein